MEPDRNPLTATEGTEAAHPRPPEPREGITGDTLADPTAQLPQSSQGSGITLTQYAILVAAGAFATTFAQQRVLGNFPTLFLLKNHLHLQKQDVAVFFFWASFAWNLKPLAGILTDAFPLLGTRRRSYMILGSLAGASFWVLLTLCRDSYQLLLIVSILLNVGMVFASTVMGGLMVEAGQRFSAPGRISSLRQIVQSISGIAGPLLGGILAGMALVPGWTATAAIAAVSLLLLAALTYFFFHERHVPEIVSPEAAEIARGEVRIPIGSVIGTAVVLALATLFFLNKETRNVGISLYALAGMFALIFALMLLPTRNPVIIRAQGQLTQLLHSRTLWMAVAMLFLVYTVPGLNTALTYRQDDQLHFPKAFIGALGSFEGVFGVIAAAAYGLFCRKLNLRVLLVGGIAANAASTLLYLVYTRGTAVPIHSLGGFVVVLSELALMDLAVRSTPVGCEALGFSLMMSVRNFGIALSDVLGTKMMDQYHVSFETLVLINAGTTFIILLFVPFLPRLVMQRKEGEPAT